MPDSTSLPIRNYPLQSLEALKYQVVVTLTFALIMVVGIASAQQEVPNARRGSKIIDDTTKQVYGPNTSRYYYEQEVFYNREVLHPIDTMIKNFHRWTYVQRYNNMYQDLGNVGTAIQPIFYQTPDVIGARSGAHVYDLYWDSESVRYFDTKSPYSNMRVVLGGKGRSTTRATFSRNINPQWNFGFTYRAMLIDKQVQRQGKGDRAVRDNYYDIYTAYRTKDSTYRVFFNYRRSFHRVMENGGVRVLDENFDNSDFADEDAIPWLLGAESNDLRKNTHLFHQVRIGKALQVYHTADWYRQTNKFIEFTATTTGEGFYDYNEIETDSTNDIAYFQTGRHEIGIKGNVSKIFYNGYYALRNFMMSNNNLASIPYPGDTVLTYSELKIPTEGRENYLGGRIALVLDSIGQISGWAEVMQSGNYRIQGEIKSKWFEARLKQMQYAPGFFEQAYRGTHDVWNNNFSNTESSTINGYLHYRSPTINVSPGLTFSRVRNHIFYKFNPEVDTLTVMPIQSAGNQIWASPELRLSLTFFRHITFSAQGIYTRFIENADEAMQVPEVFVNTQLSYDNIFFNGNLDMHTGVDIHWQSDYFANGYDPAIRQFYVQKSFLNTAFPIVDVFFSAKIKRGRIFFKYHNLVQAFTKSGYLPTPFYPGQRNVVDFGFDWSFYD